MLALGLLLAAGILSAQRSNFFSTAAQQEFSQALTAVGRFGVPRYTTALLPTCGSTNVGALTWDTTTGQLKTCDGTLWNGAGAVTNSYSWTNAQVIALPTTAGDITMVTLPAKTVVKNAYVVITGAAVGPATVTVACGRVATGYIDYIVVSDAKAAANTVYGDASGERGTNLVGYDLPSYTGTTVVNCHFISTVANLSTVTGSTGKLVLETSLVP